MNKNHYDVLEIKYGHVEKSTKLWQRATRILFSGKNGTFEMD